MPTDAAVQAVTLTSYKPHPHLNMESVIVTIFGYHSVEVTLVFGDAGKLQTWMLHRVFYRYGFYNTVNGVRATGGYTAILYRLPDSQTKTNLSRQVLAVYDTSDY